MHPAYIVSYTTRLFRTCQLLVQLTLKDKRCPPFLATAKIRYTRFRRPSSIAKFLHIARKRRRTHREPRQHCHLGKKLCHAQKRSGFTGSNGRCQDMTTTSETAMRRRMPCDSNSGALNNVFHLRLETDATRTFLPCYRRQIEECWRFHSDEVNPNRCQAPKPLRIVIIIIKKAAE